MMRKDKDYLGIIIDGKWLREFSLCLFNLGYRIYRYKKDRNFFKKVWNGLEHTALIVV